MAFISTAVEVDPATLTDEKLALLATRIPGLVVQPGHPLYHLLEAQSQTDAENRQYLTDVPDQIAQTFGEALFRVPVKQATQAVVTATVTAVDTNGPYTLPAGTQITLQGTGGPDDRVGFMTRTDVTIPNGQSSTVAGEVQLIAINAGAAGNDLQNDPQFEETFSWVSTLELTASTSGGEDAEDAATYRNRLTDRLQLVSDTLVHPDDYAIDARTNFPPVARALALDLLQAPKNETAELSHTATGGTFTLTVGANTTAGIAALATAATIKTALEGLASVGAGNVLVTGGPLPTVVRIEFVAGKAATNLAVSGNGGSLTGGGGSGSFSLITVQDGAAGVANTASKYTLAVVDEDGVDPGATIRAAGQADQQARSASGLLVTWIGPSYNTITVVFAAKSLPGFDPADVESRAEQAVLDFLSPARWGLPQTGDQPLWIDTPIVRFQDVSTVLNMVEGLSHWTTLTVNGGTVDVTMTGSAAMPAPAPTTTASGTVTA